MVSQILLNKFKKALKREGLKVTPQRIAVLEEIINSSDHRISEDIYYAIKKNKVNVSRATVYRTLDILVQSGFARKMNLEGGKKYVGKTTNVNRRMIQHLSGNGAKVTKKFKPIDAKVVDEVPGFFSDDVEQEYTEDYIGKYGYENVRGGYYTNSKTLKKSSPKKKTVTCYKCGRQGHYANQCYAKTTVNGNSFDSDNGFSDDY